MLSMGEPAVPLPPSRDLRETVAFRDLPGGEVP